MKNQLKTAIYPGSFDPITFGHLDIIKRAAKLFDRFVVAVAHDTKKTTLFHIDERVRLAQLEIQKLHDIKNIEVKPFQGLLVNFVKSEGASVIARGLRGVSDFEYEFQMSYINHKLAPNTTTILFPATANTHYISSSSVKEIARLNGRLDGLVSTEIADELKRRFSEV